MLHFYSFVFMESEPSGAITHASSYMGIPEPKVTRRVIASARRTAGVSARAVLLSVSALGAMTGEEWDAGQE